MNEYEEVPQPKRKPLNSAGAIVNMRCPECKKGIVYRNGMDMNRLCPSCGIEFEREPGYFSGAIWIASLLATPVMFFLMFGFFYFFRDLHPTVPGLLAALAFIPLVPITIKLSRSIWMYLDHQMHPQRRRGEPPGDPGESPVTPVPGTPLHGATPPEDADDDCQNGSNGPVHGEPIGRPLVVAESHEHE